MWIYVCVCVYIYIEAISVVDFELVEEGKLEIRKWYLNEAEFRIENQNVRCCEYYLVS